MVALHVRSMEYETLVYDYVLFYVAILNAHRICKANGQNDHGIKRTHFF
jgi:hypothetical protein